MDEGFVIVTVSYRQVVHGRCNWVHPRGTPVEFRLSMTSSLSIRDRFLFLIPAAALQLNSLLIVCMEHSSLVGNYIRFSFPFDTYTTSCMSNISLPFLLQKHEFSVKFYNFSKYSHKPGHLSLWYKCFIFLKDLIKISLSAYRNCPPRLTSPSASIWADTILPSLPLICLSIFQSPVLDSINFCQSKRQTTSLVLCCMVQDLAPSSTEEQLTCSSITEWWPWPRAQGPLLISQLIFFFNLYICSRGDYSLIHNLCVVPLLEICVGICPQFGQEWLIVLIEQYELVSCVKKIRQFSLPWFFYLVLWVDQNIYVIGYNLFGLEINLVIEIWVYMLAYLQYAIHAILVFFSFWDIICDPHSFFMDSKS